MAYSLGHKIFLVQSYYRNGVKVEGDRTYSLQVCMEEFPNIIIDHMQFTLPYVITLPLDLLPSFTPGAAVPKKRILENIAHAEEIIEGTPKNVNSSIISAN
ncbi:hypothetical protein Zmor_017970 [Zophobas morio]|uniref:Uncharacterized protein n=1 Tax=Zophobas morio TaxID=2755281 RepID=A0AA38MDG2_9CUCU|nr:hypothetical protein Zmor_017970 [Zophobas morio]